ncbi:MAG: hypothetical protein ACK456_12825 [Pseudanabaenaceae cyanobacterium]|jgi:hypothetical protein
MLDTIFGIRASVALMVLAAAVVSAPDFSNTAARRRTASEVTPWNTLPTVALEMYKVRSFS